MNKEKRPFLWSYHYFRAFAILNIIFIHTWRLSPNTEYKDMGKWLDSVRDMLFHGSTIYFLFISGFLFHYLSHKFQINRYYTSKFKNVVLPYIFISVFLILAQDLTGVKANIDAADYLYTIPKQLILGTASFQFWYIPFIVLVFLMSPLFLAIKTERFLKIVPWLFLLPLLGTRTQVYITFWQFVYFLPVYLLGMYTSANMAFIDAYVKKRIGLLIALAIVSSILILFVDQDLIYLELFRPLESLIYVQKVSITFIILYLTRNLSGNKFPILGIIADCSFSLFFLHIIFDRHLKRIYYMVESSIPELLQIPASIVYVFLLTTVVLLFTLSVKKILGKYSKYFTGY